LNDKRIQQILDIEKEADAIRAAAVKEAQQIPQQAEQEAQALINKARSDAEQEARTMLANAQADEESAKILAEAQEKIKHNESLAARHLDRAVSYVLARVVGRE
jgi:V/A-type H+/Na+-transporting ATPase subunit G/H